MTETLTILPHPLPVCANARILLFAIRRMGAHGLADAHAAQVMVTAFGHGFRRPLVLMRTLMAELASTAAGMIAIAPCCCARMTPAEAALIAIVARVDGATDTARLLATDLLGVRRVEPVLMAAGAVANAFADAGRPVAG